VYISPSSVLSLSPSSLDSSTVRRATVVVPNRNYEAKKYELWFKNDRPLLFSQFEFSNWSWFFLFFIRTITFNWIWNAKGVDFWIMCFLFSILLWSSSIWILNWSSLIRVCSDWACWSRAEFSCSIFFNFVVNCIFHFFSIEIEIKERKNSIRKSTLINYNQFFFSFITWKSKY
jgi:hypothetical protein